MDRREVLRLLGLGAGVGIAVSLISCDAGTGPDLPPGGDDDGGGGVGPDAAVTPGADGASPDACAHAFTTLHDTEAQALYLDGSLGPLTGTIRVSYMMAGAAITLDFWHGHGGQQHRFTLTPAMLDDLKAGKKITVGTSMVDGHAHTLFIDPKDERYRTPGAPDVMVDLGCA